MLESYVKKILSSNVYDLAEETPLTHAPLLSGRLKTNVWLKREDHQPIYSFKLRGAYNKMSQLDAQQSSKGVITASAGNHAQGVSIAASRLGLQATVVMGLLPGGERSTSLKVVLRAAMAAMAVALHSLLTRACIHF